MVDLYLHDEVKRSLKAKQVTFSDIAEDLSVSPSLVTMVSQGHRYSPKVAGAIAKYLGKVPADIWPAYKHEEAKMLTTEN